MMKTRSSLTPSGITARNFSPICAQASASAMLVLPLDASTTRSPHFSRPCRHAFSRMNRAMRSFVLPLGFRNSSLHQIGGSGRVELHRHERRRRDAVHVSVAAGQIGGHDDLDAMGLML